jgi:hypothetical protein
MNIFNITFYIFSLLFAIHIYVYIYIRQYGSDHKHGFSTYYSKNRQI